MANKLWKNWFSLIKLGGKGGIISILTSLGVWVTTKLFNAGFGVSLGLTTMDTIVEGAFIIGLFLTINLLVSLTLSGWLFKIYMKAENDKLLPKF